MRAQNTSHQTSEYLDTQNIELMTHPPYSLDLAPKDFFLFPKIKDGQRFFSPDEAVEAFIIHNFIKAIIFGLAEVL